MNNILGAIQPIGFPGVPDDFECSTETVYSVDRKHHWFTAQMKSKTKKPKRALFIIHGIGEHGGRYFHFPHYLKSVYDQFFFYDQRGHGRSSGYRGHIDRFEDFVEDAYFLAKRFKDSLDSDTEVDLFCHSMGGLIGLRVLFRYPQSPFSRAIVSSPVLQIKIPLPILKRAGAQLLSRIWPQVQMDAEVRADVLSHDRNVVDCYLKDQLVHYKGTPRLYTEMLKTFEDVNQRDIGIQIPILFIIPTDDQIVSSDQTLIFAEKLKSNQKKIAKFKGFYHEGHNELKKEEVFEAIKEFVQTYSKT